MLIQDGTPVHFPAKPEKFEFDAEVAEVFPNMAERSIPNFHLAHRLHVGMAEGLLIEPGCRVLDVGASRGHFYEHILEQGFHRVAYTAIDNSKPMCDMLQARHPSARVLHMDLTGDDFEEHSKEEQYEVICCNYVLQFLPVNAQIVVLLSLVQMLTRGGLLLIGHKAQHRGYLGEMSHRAYHKFRRDNGYSQKEIDAKTKALQGSMFPMNHQFLMDTLSQCCSEVAETTRYMMFSTLVARK